MPFNVVAAGTSLQLLFTDGTIQTVALPLGVFLKGDLPARFAILGRNVVCVGAPSTPVWIDEDGVARTLRISTPSQAPVLAAGAAGGLTGAFRIKVAFVIKDVLGGDLAQSALSVPSAPVTLAAQMGAVSEIPISSNEAVNARRVYRTTAGPGAEYFEWFDLDDNTTTTFTDDAPDAALALLPAPDDLGPAPFRLSLCIEWKGFLWGVSPSAIDTLLFSTANTLYAWPADQSIVINPVGKDRFGITGLIPRRDELGVARRDIIWKIIGSDAEDFRAVKLIEGTGVYAPDSVNVTRDVARFLAQDGVYAWDAGGVSCISDGDVKGWFTSDTYFNRALFPTAVARYNPLRNAYDLFLAAAGSTALDRWVSFDIDRKRWLGPHKTGAFTPTAAGVVLNASELFVPCIGSSTGFLYLVVPGTFRDGAATAIDLDVVGAAHTGGAPDIEHLWGMLSTLIRKQTGGTLSIVPTVGDLAASAGATITHAMTLERQKARILGPGRLLQMRFQNAEVNRDCEIFGYELPYHELGRR